MQCARRSPFVLLGDASLDAVSQPPPSVGRYLLLKATWQASDVYRIAEPSKMC
jgi:hypothetical protein